MTLTRVFRSGNSQAVRIPAELAYADAHQDFKITRLGEVITIMPARYSIEESIALLRSLGRSPEVEWREPREAPPDPRHE
jgi:antitoxin VapB